jgi:hypothetical protein
MCGSGSSRVYGLGLCLALCGLAATKDTATAAEQMSLYMLVMDIGQQQPPAHNPLQVCANSVKVVVLSCHSVYAVLAVCVWSGMPNHGAHAF